MKKLWFWIVKIWSIIGERWCDECNQRMHSWGFSPGSGPGAASREYFCERCEPDDWDEKDYF